jgi:hypothetical protein
MTTQRGALISVAQCLEKGAFEGGVVNEREIWAASERLDLLFSLLPTRIQQQRANSHLRSLTIDFIDYITRSDVVSDGQAQEVGRAILGVFRVVTSIESLYGKPIDPGIKNHSLFQEIERLFDNSELHFEGPEFTLFTAAHITVNAQERVAFVPEMGKSGEKTPDLRVSDLCYLECKDLAPASPEGVRSAMCERLQDASKQLGAARRRDPALASGEALDLPLRLFQPDVTGSCPAALDAHAIAAKALSLPGTIDFILLSFSGFRATATHFAFPYRLAIYVREGVPDALFIRLFKRMGEEGLRKPHVYIVPRDQEREHRIRERAFFLWENRSGRFWWNSVSNWIEAEEQDDRNHIF